MKIFYVYILTNAHHTVFYTGFTNDLLRRTSEHKEELRPGFSKSYQTKKLIYFEEYGTAACALKREKQLKRYKRAWKFNLINALNPAWRDLYEDFVS